MKDKTKTGRKHKYHFNEKVFDRVTPDVAYLLGLLYTDGCLHANQPTIQIGSIDLTQVQNVERILGGKNLIQPKHANGKPYYIIAVTSAYATERLKALGLTPRKSLTMKFPTWLDDTTFGPFVRGVFDGNGSIAPAKMYRSKITARIYSSSTAFARKLRNALKAKGLTLGYYVYQTPKGKPNIQIIIAQRSLAKFYELLYPSLSVPALDRKRQRFDEFYNRKCA